jgi:hypothetical protein
VLESSPKVDKMPIRVPKSQCPWCGHGLDAVGGGSKIRPPDPGDLTICLYCGGVAQFDEDLNLERPLDCTIEEAEQILRLLLDEGDGRIH